MALVKTGEKALDISANDIQKPETTKKQDVLDEDSYIQVYLLTCTVYSTLFI